MFTRLADNNFHTGCCAYELFICGKQRWNHEHFPVVLSKKQFNSSPPSAAYMRQSIGSALVQIMACRLFAAKPLCKPMLGYQNTKNISFTKMHLNISSVKWRPFWPGEDESINVLLQMTVMVSSRSQYTFPRAHFPTIPPVTGARTRLIREKNFIHRMAFFSLPKPYLRDQRHDINCIYRTIATDTDKPKSNKLGINNRFHLDWLDCLVYMLLNHDSKFSYLKPLDWRFWNASPN